MLIVNKDLWESWPDEIKYVVLDEAIREERSSTIEAVTLGGPECVIEQGMELVCTSSEVIDKCYEAVKELVSQPSPQKAKPQTKLGKPLNS